MTNIFRIIFLTIISCLLLGCPIPPQKPDMSKLPLSELQAKIRSHHPASNNQSYIFFINTISAWDFNMIGGAPSDGSSNIAKLSLQYNNKEQKIGEVMGPRYACMKVKYGRYKILIRNDRDEPKYIEYTLNANKPYQFIDLMQSGSYFALKMTVNETSNKTGLRILYQPYSMDQPPKIKCVGLN